MSAPGGARGRSPSRHRLGQARPRRRRRRAPAAITLHVNGRDPARRTRAAKLSPLTAAVHRARPCRAVRGGRDASSSALPRHKMVKRTVTPRGGRRRALAGALGQAAGAATRPLRGAGHRRSRAPRLPRWTRQDDAVQRRAAARALRPDAERSCATCSSQAAALHYVVPRTGVYDDGTGARGDGLAQGSGHGAHLHRQRRRVHRPAHGQRRLQGPPPAGRPPRRGAPGPAGAGPDQRHARSSGSTTCPRASRRRRPSAGASASTPRRRARTPRAWSTRTTSSAATPSTATLDVPTYNASHGCLRVPIPNARSIYDWLRIGDVVWVES